MDERNETNPLLCVSGVFVPEDMARKIREVATAQGLSVLDIFSGLALLGAWTIAPPTRALIKAAKHANNARILHAGERTLEDCMASQLARCDQCRQHRHFGRTKTPEGHTIIHLSCGHSRPATWIGER